MLLGFAACATRAALAPVPVVTSPAFPEFVEPVVPPILEGAGASAVRRGWRFLQAGDMKSAEREFSSTLRADTAFYPAEVGMGYVELARKNLEPALSHFDKALERERRDVPALVGQGLALLALNREENALSAFEAALAVEPGAADIARRVEVVRFRVQQAELSRAREAMRAGRLEEAASLYAHLIQGSPDSAVLYRERAAIERQQKAFEPALADLRKAAALDSSDSRSLIQIGEILEARGDFDGAARAYADANLIEPSHDLEVKLGEIRQRAELARLPAEYRAIPDVSQVTRGDLAALLGVRILPLLPALSRQEAVLITDIRNHWAADWIVAVARAGVMQPFANHTFQPRTVLRRSEMAQVINRLLNKLPGGGKKWADDWRLSRRQFADLAEGHAAYPAASVAVASGVMTVDATGNFFPARSVAGAEATDAVAKLEAIVRSAERSGNSR
jgi:tetratricopeptide (TPR) repeat protein